MGGESKTEQLRTRGKSCSAGEAIGRRSDEREHNPEQTGGRRSEGRIQMMRVLGKVEEAGNNKGMRDTILARD